MTSESSISGHGDMGEYERPGRPRIDLSIGLRSFDP